MNVWHWRTSKQRTFFIVCTDHNVWVCEVRVALSPLNLRPRKWSVVRNLRINPGGFFFSVEETALFWMDHFRPAHSDFPKSLHVFAQELWFTKTIKSPVLKFYAYFLIGQEASRSLRIRSLPAVSKLWSLQMRRLKPSWREKVGRSIATTSICPCREMSMEMGRNRSSQPAASALLFSPL